MNKFFTIIIASMLMSFGYWGDVAAAPKSTTTDPDRIELQIRENKTLIKEKKKEKLFAERSLGVLARELKYTELSLNRAKSELDSSVMKERESREKMNEVRRKYSESSAQFSERLRSIYQNQNLGFIEYLFSSKDLTSIVDSAYYFDRVLSRDSNLIQSLRHQFSEVAKEKARVERETRRIMSLKSEIGQRENDLSAKAMKQKKYIASLQSQIQVMEKQTKELERSSAEIAQAIRRMGGNNRSDNYFGSGEFLKPVQAWVSSYFGYRLHPIFKRRILHTGVDFGAPSGTRILAADSGNVIVAGEKRQYHGYGRITIIDHGRRRSDGKRVSSVYAHQSRIMVSEGQTVNRGDEIGRVGSTGYATGPHLHFEIREDGIPVDPLRYVR